MTLYRFLTLAPYFRKGIGIDTNPGMIEQAQQNKVVDSEVEEKFRPTNHNFLSCLCGSEVNVA